jgi:hypothetical protein
MFDEVWIRCRFDGFKSMVSKMITGRAAAGMSSGDVTFPVVISGLNLICEFLFVRLDSRSDFMRLLN